MSREGSRRFVDLAAAPSLGHARQLVGAGSGLRQSLATHLRLDLGRGAEISVLAAGPPHLNALRIRVVTPSACWSVSAMMTL